MYTYGVWGQAMKLATGLNQAQTNILAGVIFSGGSFLTNFILFCCSKSLKWSGLAPGLVGALAYALLGLLPDERLNFWVMLVLIGMVGYAVMGLFICAIQAIGFVNKLDGR